MNKSANYTMLSVVILSKGPTTVTYRLAHTKAYGGFTWVAKTGQGRMIIDSLEVGEKYFIRVASDQSGCQHWLEAKKIVSGPLASDAITRHAAKKAVEPKLREDFLVWGDEEDVTQYDDPVMGPIRAKIEAKKAAQAKS